MASGVRTQISRIVLSPAVATSARARSWTNWSTSVRSMGASASGGTSSWHACAWGGEGKGRERRRWVGRQGGAGGRSRQPWRQLPRQAPWQVPAGRQWVPTSSPQHTPRRITPCSPGAPAPVWP
jgi:hypothetical protein